MFRYKSAMFFLLTYIKGVTMRAIFSNPAGWKFIDSNGWKKKDAQ